MLDMAIVSPARRACLLVMSAVAALLPACAAIDSTETEETAAGDLRAYFEGAASIPGEEGRAHLRAELARAATRASGARRSGLDPDTEEGWWPVGERAGTRLLPADTSVWQRDGDIDATGAFVPLRAACPPRAPVDITALPDDVRGPELPERAERLACALDRLAGTEVRLEWTSGPSRAAILDPEEGTALVHPRLLALVEPEDKAARAAGVAVPVAPGELGAGGPGGEPDAFSGEPPAEPLDLDDNENHPRPPTNSSGGGSSRTFCDRVCDDVWNDVFDCDCGGNPGSTGSDESCDCNGSPGSSSSGCGSNACKCGTAHRGAQDRAGLFAAAVVMGTLVLRRRRGPRRPPARRSWRGVPWLFLFLVGLLTWPAGAVAAPPAKLVDVRVTVTPPEAALFIDGNAVLPEHGVVRVPAGKHTFSAKLDGYSDAIEAVEVPERGTGTLVTLRLAANKGYTVITSRDPAATLLVDGAEVGKGSFSGLVAPGNHVITATDAAGRPRSYVVTVIAGQSITVSVDGPPTYFPPPPPGPPSPAPPPSEKKPAPPRPPQQSGPYALLNVTMLWQTGRPFGFEHADTPAPGVAVGGRAGYRFTNVVGLEALVEYGRIANGGVVAQTFAIDQDGDGVVSGGEADTDRSPASHVLESLRFGPVLRLTSDGRENRFVGGIGLGAMHENIYLEHADLAWNPAQARYVSQGTFRHAYEGWIPYLLFEGGYERSIRSILAAVLLQISLESVSGIAQDPYSSALQARVGLSLRAGWAGW